MKIRFFAIIVSLMLGTTVFSQVARDTIFIYDTIRITVTRPAPPPTIFFEEPTATISKDSIIIDEQSRQSSTMSNFRQSANRLIRRIAVGTMAVATSVTTAFAEIPSESQLDPLEIEIQTQVDTIIRVDSIFEIESKKRAPIYLSFAYPLGLFGTESENYIFNFAFSLLTGAVGGIEGIQWAGLYNQVSGRVNGVQWAGLINLTQEIQGAQWAGICNFTHDVRGIQWAGIMNQSNNVSGAQWAGVLNVANNVEGMQWSGVYGVADTLKGLQWSGIASEAKVVQGMQWGGIISRADQVRGLQMGLINSTRSLSGVQIGLVNRADTTHSGLSIGLININNRDRFREIEVNVTTHGSTLLGYRIGRPVFHTMFAVGTNWNRNYIETRFGFGNLTRLHNSLYLQTSFYGNHSTSRLHRNSWRETPRFQHDNWMTLSSGLVYYWGGRLGIKVIPSFQYWTNFNRPLSRIWTASYAFGLDVGLSVRL